jgi:hypothetical protein
VSDYGLKVVSSDGTTVIIDGTSNMFKIAASGTLQTASFAQPNQQTAQADISTGFTYAPVFFYFPQFATGIWSGLYVRWAAGTSLVHESFLMNAEVVNTNQTRVIASTNADGAGTEGARTYTYYIMKEAAI